MSLDLVWKDALSAQLGFRAVVTLGLLNRKLSVAAGHFGGLTVTSDGNYGLQESVLSSESLNPLVLLLSADRSFFCEIKTR